MSQTAITVQKLSALSKGAPIAGALDLTMTAADTVNGNSFAFTGKEILLIQNTDSSTHHVTVSSVADGLGRTGDIATYALAANDIAAIDCDSLTGWVQSGGLLFILGDNALVKFAILRHN